MSRRAPGQVSLERALSKLGIASRSSARAMITAGRVSIEGKVALDPGQPVVPERLRITIDGAAQRRVGWATLMFHKPPGCVVSRNDPEGRPTVYDQLADLPSGANAVGRLDMMSSGLLLFTNDTQFANWVTDPNNKVPRRYVVTVRGAIGPRDLPRLCEGVIEAGERLFASQALVRKRSSRETHLLVTLVEGKNREIRRLFAAIGHEVTRLKRIAFGGLELGDLPAGATRTLRHDTLQAAFPKAPLRSVAS